MCRSVLRYVAVFTVFSFLFWYVAVCRGVLQCVAVCCSVLQCVASCATPICMSAALEGYVAVCCSVLWCIAVRCSVFQCVAVCCGVLQCVAVCCSVFLPARRQSACRPLCNILQYTATYCNTLQHYLRNANLRVDWFGCRVLKTITAVRVLAKLSQVSSTVILHGAFYRKTTFENIYLLQPQLDVVVFDCAALVCQKKRIYIKRDVYTSRGKYTNQRRRI